jgi:WD40 repeat protein
VRLLSVPGKRIYAVTHHPNNRVLVSGDSGGCLRFWDRLTGQERASAQLESHHEVVDLAFSPDGALLSTQTCLLETARLQSGLAVDVSANAAPSEGNESPSVIHAQLHIRSSLFSEAEDFVFARDGKLVGARWLSPRFVLWDGETRRPVRSFDIPGFESGSPLAFAPDTRTVAIAQERRLVVVDALTGEQFSCLPHQADVYSVVFLPQESLLATSAGRQVQFWDWRKGDQVERFRASGDELPSLALHPSGPLLMSGCLDGTIRFWDVQAMREKESRNWRIGPIWDVAFAPDGMTAAAGGGDGAIAVWDIDDL